MLSNVMSNGEMLLYCVEGHYKYYQYGIDYLIHLTERDSAEGVVIKFWMDYQDKYQTLKRKLKILLYEQESLQKELEKSQHKLLRVSRDKSFLLDRLLLYEQVSEDSDSDATLSSDGGVDSSMRKKTGVLASKVDQQTKNVSVKSEGVSLTATDISTAEEDINVTGDNDSQRLSIKQENDGLSPVEVGEAYPQEYINEKVDH